MLPFSVTAFTVISAAVAVLSFELTNAVSIFSCDSLIFENSPKRL